MTRPARRKIGEALVEAGLLSELQLRSALADQKRWGNRLGKTLVKLGFVGERPLMRQLSRLMGLPLAEIDGRAIAREVLELVPRELAEKHRCVPLFVDEDGAARFLYVGMEEPADAATLVALQHRAGLEVCPALIGFRALDAALHRYYGVGEARGEEAFEIGGERRLVGPDCLRHGDDAIVGDVEPAPDAVAAVAAPAPPGRAEVPTRRLLQALTQLLVEQGVIDRGQFLERVRRLADGEDDGRPEGEDDGRPEGG